MIHRNFIFTCLILQVEGDHHATEIYPPVSHEEYDGVHERSDKLYQSCFVKLYRSSTLEGANKFVSEAFHLNELNKKKEFFHDINSDSY